MVTDTWQPISTAPKEGYALLYNGEIGIGYWMAWCRDASGRVLGTEEDDDREEYVDRWEWSGEGFEVKPPPTHWMPLPQPPEPAR